MIIYTDGSSLHGVKPYAKVGFACVILSESSIETRTGVHCGATTGSHEVVAFIEACRAAGEQHVAPADLTIFTDDQSLGYAGFYLHPGNYRATARKIREAIGCACNKHFDKHSFDLAMWYAAEARIHKVKSHVPTTPVYHHWADYRARCACQDKEPMLFSDWLAKGFFFPTGTDESGALIGKQHFAPFTASLDCGKMSYI